MSGIGCVIKGIEIINASKEFTDQGFKKVIKITSEFFKLEDAEEEARVKDIIKIGKEVGAVAEVIWDNVPEEGILICFHGLYFEQINLTKNLQKKLEDYFRYLKK